MTAYTPTHVGTKLIKAVPMTEVEYKEYLGWTMPPSEIDEPGYLVEYEPNATVSNVNGHLGYVTWIPKEVFDEAYRQLNTMSFSDALLMLERGKRVARSNWNGKDMFIF